MLQDNNYSSQICEHSFKAMGGEFFFKCYPQSFLSKSDMKNIFIKAEKEVIRIENKFTEFKESSLTAINKNAGAKKTQVDDETWRLIQNALQVSRDSGGLFDITVSCIGKKWRDAKNDGRVLSEKDLNKLQPYVNYKLVDCNLKKQTIYLPSSNMRIGLGGIGKGYAVDQAFDVIKKSGADNFYINGAGDIKVSGHLKSPRPWRIGIRNPLSQDREKSIGVIQLRNGSVATSGNYIQNNRRNGEIIDHHIVHPYQKKTSVISTTVISPKAIDADTTATVLMNMEPVRGIKYLDTKEMAGLIVCRKGRVYLSAQARNIFGI